MLFDFHLHLVFLFLFSPDVGLAAAAGLPALDALAAWYRILTCVGEVR